MKRTQRSPTPPLIFLLAMPLRGEAHCLWCPDALHLSRRFFFGGERAGGGLPSPRGRAKPRCFFSTPLRRPAAALSSLLDVLIPPPLLHPRPPPVSLSLKRLHLHLHYSPFRTALTFWRQMTWELHQSQIYVYVYVCVYVQCSSKKVNRVVSPSFYVPLSPRGETPPPPLQSCRVTLPTSSLSPGEETSPPPLQLFRATPPPPHLLPSPS